MSSTGRQKGPLTPSDSAEGGVGLSGWCSLERIGEESGSLVLGLLLFLED